MTLSPVFTNLFDESIDVKNIQTSESISILRKQLLPNCPASSLIQKISVLKRDPRILQKWTDATVIVTNDHFMHVLVYSWEDNQVGELRGASNLEN